ncbi:hypothetical protein J8F10_06480 [Gemmata sp. G18]|uniref:Glycosyltransferase 2-like domain-containing protein n=1 Tax=Gemmata palustris TaxID=2822762 RepID=A0ABS5BMK6_9BACT|nr:glycosyltransferase family A protein [Gemmata palustris]MBP3954926.1 hypothetical protein [Gemmata palustris]
MAAPQSDRAEEGNLNFSIVMPSRERVPLLTQCLQSIADTTADLSSVEVLVYIDNCDSQTIAATHKLRQQFPFLDFLQGARPENLSRDCYNPLAARTTGRFLQIFNDDAQLFTKGWDVAALEVLNSFQEQHPDGILMGCPNDDTGCDYACFPMLSREAVNALGFAQNPGFGGWGSDIHLDKVFTALGRKVPLPYDIRHSCVHNRTRGRDRVSLRMSRLSKYPWEEVEKDAERLRKIIGENTR